MPIIFGTSFVSFIVQLFYYCSFKVKVKVKFTLEQATKAQRG
jgi:hypothetical protein